jgi:hypothetical protein
MLHRRRALDRSPELAEEIARHIAGNDRLSPAEQLEIYREQYWLRHTSSLVQDFPGLGGILGQEAWQRLVEEYLLEPSSSWTLRDLGRALPAHVERSTWLPHHALCVDMARLEWGYIEIFDAAQGGSLDASRLASISDEQWETAVIVLSPALRLLRVDYPVARLRQRLRERPTDAVPIPEREPKRLVLYRAKDRNLRHASLDAGAFALLDALGKGTPLVAACERAAEDAPEDADRIASEVGAWFQDWGRRGWITDVRVG